MTKTRAGFIRLDYAWIRAAAIDVITELEVITTAGYRYSRGDQDDDDELLDAITRGRQAETEQR
jgi:hypothetical protein